MANESKGPRTKMLLVYVGATDSSDQPKGFVHVCSVVFTWLCPRFQCTDSSGYSHFPYRDNDMIFRILDLLSNSHAAVVMGGLSSLSSLGSSLPASTLYNFIDNCLHASCSILCGIHSADETQSGRNSCPEFAFLTFSLDSIMSLSR